MTFVEGTEAALSIIESWGWDHSDPRFDFHVPVMVSLSTAINRLAMEGHKDPASAVLSLLASGRLESTGSYRFKAYRNGHFQHDGIGQIPTARWQTLFQGCQRNGDLFAPNEVTLGLINGDWTERKESSAVWSWSSDHFTTAQTSEGDWLDDGYFEETYWAADIEIRPAEREAASLLSEVPAANRAEPNKGGAPPKYDWEQAVAAIVFQWADEGSWQGAAPCPHLPSADAIRSVAAPFRERRESAAGAGRIGKRRQQRRVFPFRAKGC